MCNQSQHILIFGTKFILLHSGKLTQTHFNNGARLYFGKSEALHQTGTGFFRVFRIADNLNSFVKIIENNHKSFEQVSSFFGFTKFELRTTNHHIVTVLHKIMNQIFQIQHARTAIYQCNIIHTERRLQSCHFKQLVQNHI